MVHAELDLMFDGIHLQRLPIHRTFTGHVHAILCDHITAFIAPTCHQLDKDRFRSSHQVAFSLPYITFPVAAVQFSSCDRVVLGVGTVRQHVRPGAAP